VGLGGLFEENGKARHAFVGWTKHQKMQRHAFFLNAIKETYPERNRPLLFARYDRRVLSSS
jgi:hypothetical protein